MGAITTPGPVKLICGVLLNPAVSPSDIEPALVSEFGAVELWSPTWPFDFTDYYDAETGPNIQRAFAAFEQLVAMDALAEIKWRTNALEAALADRVEADAPRPVNLDPGYVNSSRLVLASTKDCAHRVYLGQGIYAEVTLTFRRGEFQPWPWTYADYATPEYRRFFRQVRQRYLRQRRSQR